MLDGKNMFYAKRILQCFVFLLLMVYTTLLLYQSQVAINSVQTQDVNQVEKLETKDVPKNWPKDELMKKWQAAKNLGPIRILGNSAATATYLDDIFISVKTTKHYHSSRLPVILKTWFQMAKRQTWFFTDADQTEYQTLTNGHMINTNCSSTHNRKALCCKMSVEYDTFLDSNKKWFCHFDDDNYVNVPRLVQVLSSYNPQKDWYLGKPSIRAPLEIPNRNKRDENSQRNISFWFATGGAGFCLSKSLALKMVSIASGGKFMGVGEKIRLPDDVTMGYIIEYLLEKPLTVIQNFHSHLEPMKFLKQDTFREQITFSYSQYGKNESNVLNIDGFDVSSDPTRFYSLHCHLFPGASFCPRK